MKHSLRVVAVLLVSIMFAQTSHAQETKSVEVVFDFESLATSCDMSGSHSAQGAFPYLNMERSGLRIEIGKPDSAFDIVENAREGEWVFPDFFGRKTLSAFFEMKKPAPLIINFSTEVSLVSILAGDFGDDNDEIRLEAFSKLDAKGEALQNHVMLLPAGGSKFDYHRLVVAAPNIRSVRLIGGSADYPHSMYYDNLVVQYSAAPVNDGSSSQR